MLCLYCGGTGKVVQKQFLKFAEVSERLLWESGVKALLPPSAVEESQGDTNLGEETINNETTGAGR